VAFLSTLVYLPGPNICVSDLCFSFNSSVPTEMREKVVSVAHDTLLAGHRGASKTLSRVQQEFYWLGVHECVTRYVASCDLCQRNVSKGTVPKAPIGKLPLISTPFSTICVDVISPPSDRYILTTINTCTRFPEARPLKDSG